MTERTTPVLPLPSAADQPEDAAAADAAPETAKLPRLEPTRYGDWELKGKCVDF